MTLKFSLHESISYVTATEELLEYIFWKNQINFHNLLKCKGEWNHQGCENHNNKFFILFWYFLANSKTAAVEVYLHELFIILKKQ